MLSPVVWNWNEYKHLRSNLPLCFSLCRWNCGTSTRWPASHPWCLWTRPRGRWCVGTDCWWSGMIPKVRIGLGKVKGGPTDWLATSHWTVTPTTKAAAGFTAPWWVNHTLGVVTLNSCWHLSVSGQSLLECKLVWWQFHAGIYSQSPVCFTSWEAWDPKPSWNHSLLHAGSLKVLDPNPGYDLCKSGIIYHPH